MGATRLSKYIVFSRLDSVSVIYSSCVVVWGQHTQTLTIYMLSRGCLEIGIGRIRFLRCAFRSTSDGSRKETENITWPLADVVRKSHHARTLPTHAPRRPHHTFTQVEPVKVGVSHLGKSRIIYELRTVKSLLCAK